MLAKQIPIAFSGDIPAHYDAYLGPMFFEPFALKMADHVGQLSANHILELASGTGRLTKLLPVVAPNARITASDINPAMVSYGKSKINHEKIKWFEIDAVSLPFDNHSFDCVVVQFGVMFYSNRADAFKEAWRVLKPGGTFIFSCWDEITNNPIANITNIALIHHFPVDTPAFYQVPFSYYNEEEILNDLVVAGFKDIKIELTKLTGSSPSAKHAAKGLIYGTPTVTAIQDLDASKLPLICKDLEDEISRHFGEKQIRVPLQARVVSAVKK